MIVFDKLRISFYVFLSVYYLDAKLRSFHTLLQTQKFARRLTAELGYFGAYLPRLLTCVQQTFPFLLLYLHEIDCMPVANIHAREFPLNFRAELECWTKVLNYRLPVHDRVSLHDRLSWFMS